MHTMEQKMAMMEDRARTVRQNDARIQVAVAVARQVRNGKAPKALKGPKPLSKSRRLRDDAWRFRAAQLFQAHGVTHASILAEQLVQRLIVGEKRLLCVVFDKFNHPQIAVFAELELHRQHVPIRPTYVQDVTG